MALFVNENSFFHPAEFSTGSKVASKTTCKCNNHHSPLRSYTREPAGVLQCLRWGRCWQYESVHFISEEYACWKAIEMQSTGAKGIPFASVSQLSGKTGGTMWLQEWRQWLITILGLEQWFSIKGYLSLKGHFTMSENSFGCQNWFQSWHWVGRNGCCNTFYRAQRSTTNSPTPAHTRKEESDLMRYISS